MIISCVIDFILSVRLVRGKRPTEGRVEVFYRGEWRTVCDDGWDLDNARVVCRMLGFDGALEAPTGARFSQGSGSIHLDKVRCSGSEDSLVDCDHKGFGDHDCDHRKDASVICVPNGMYMRYIRYHF